MASDRDDGWLAAEQPIGEALVAELQRLKRRARTRWLLILLIAAGLTGFVMYRRARKPRFHKAQVVLAVEEGSLTEGHHPMPVHELRDYILSVLLSNQVIGQIVEEYDLFQLRHKMGIEYGINEFRDMFDVGVFRNYFLYQYDVDAPRSARIAIVFTHTDPDFAWKMAHRLATEIVEGEQHRRLEMAEQLVNDARIALARVRERVGAIEAQIADRSVRIAEAERLGRKGVAAALSVELVELEAQAKRESEAILGLSQQANIDVMAAELDRARLGLGFTIAEEKRPIEEPAARLYVQIIVGTFVFFVMLPIVAVFIGAFDTRIHDREDAERIGLPVLGHLPGFPGDDVGSLRARGVRGRRVPS